MAKTCMLKIWVLPKTNKVILLSVEKVLFAPLGDFLSLVVVEEKLLLASVRNAPCFAVHATLSLLTIGKALGNKVITIWSERCGGVELL